MEKRKETRKRMKVQVKVRKPKKITNIHVEINEIEKRIL